MNARPTLTDVVAALAASAVALTAFQLAGWYAAPMAVVCLVALTLNARAAALSQYVSGLQTRAD